jgi:hypothetical protein
MCSFVSAERNHALAFFLTLANMFLKRSATDDPSGDTGLTAASESSAPAKTP